LPPRAEDAGAEAYRRVCAECHANTAVVARRFANLAPEARRQRWETFLQRHHGGDAEQRAAVIGYFERAATPPR
jgi:mono/diheme cytochrome c family protein